MKDQPPEARSGYRVFRTRAARRRRRIRILVGTVAVLVIAVVAVVGGSYWWFSAKVGTANERIDEATEEALATKPSTTLVSLPVPESKEAVNIVLLGNDTREDTVAGTGRSDTIMLLHIDPALDFASVMSIPRDLWVEIPGREQNRINAAYAYGGAPLTIKTVKHVLGIDVTKYVEVGFQSFEGIVDSLGGVYIDVDRRYNQATPRPIDLNPGYQLLNGPDALVFARYRFDQNYDFGRMTRQQRVLAAIREQAMGWNLPLKLPGLVSAALESVATNLSANDILKLAYWLVKLDGSRIRQIVIVAPGKMIDGKSVVVAEEDALKEAVVKFLSPPEVIPEGSTASATTLNPGTTAATEVSTPEISAPDLILLAATTTTASDDFPNSDMWKAAQTSIPFALQAPRFIPEGFGFTYKWPQDGGTYQIEPSGTGKPAVRMLYRYQSKDLYLGVSATTWLDAPLASKGVEVEENGVTYTIVGTSGKVDRIWWKKDGVLYFISNTLMYTVGKDDLLKMALSMAPVDAAD